MTAGTCRVSTGALVEAALARDADEAVRLLREHLTTTSELLIDGHSGSGDGTRSNAEASA